MGVEGSSKPTIGLSGKNMIKWRAYPALFRQDVCPLVTWDVGVSTRSHLTVAETLSARLRALIKRSTTSSSTTSQTGPDCPTHPAVRHLNAKPRRPSHTYCESMTTTRRIVSERKCSRTVITAKSSALLLVWAEWGGRNPLVSHSPITTHPYPATHPTLGCCLADPCVKAKIHPSFPSLARTCLASMASCCLRSCTFCFLVALADSEEVSSQNALMAIPGSTPDWASVATASWNCVRGALKVCKGSQWMSCEKTLIH